MPHMPAFLASKSKQKLKDQIAEQERLTAERERQFRAQRQEQERQQAERERQHRAQREEADRREREYKENIARLEYQEFQRKELVRQQQEAEVRRLEEQRIQEQQLKMHDQERENIKNARLRQTEPEALRHLRDLIRNRYKADIYMWSLRGVKKADQEIVLEEGAKADGILDEIEAMVKTWDQRDWTEEEWKVASKIKRQLFRSDRRRWNGNPPWNTPV